ncbi:MAG: glycosyltransferase family 4 protein [Psychromonas sp.]|nr:glycosyltransferase family 4 protein [Alteromonadales bacterium]MCP5077438.1 glycosyltransferase family 4 protein [Psychromonas sp.]
MGKVVWYISKYANIQQFGAETRQASFCKEFSENGYDVRLVLSNSSHLFPKLPEIKGRYLCQKNDGYDVTWVNTLKYKNATSILRLISWLWFEFFVILLPFIKGYKKPDVVIASSLSIMSVISGSFFKLFFKSKFIFEVRDIWPQSLVDLKGLSKKHPLIMLLGWLEKIGYKYADEIVGTMPGLKKHVESVIGSCNKVHFIPQGVSLDFYQDKQEEVSRKYIADYFPENKFIVTYAGTLGVANALSYIVEAAKVLSEENTNIHFVFIGDGREEDNLKLQADGVSNLTFAPRVKKEQVQSILSASNLLVASVNNEKVYQSGISLNKFIDYMFAKKPIVCMFSGYPSMINEANCGEFTPSEDPVLFANCLLRYEAMSKDELSKLGQNGYDFLVQKRNFDVLSQQYMGLFDDKTIL